jgi:hypothetical protein
MIAKWISICIAAGCLVLVGVATSDLQAATITVSNTDDDGPGSLRAALRSASDGDTIDATGITGTILLTSAELVVSKSVTIVGPGPGTLSVNGHRKFRVFNIGANTVVTISGLTIIRGRTTGVRHPDESGGGIYNAGSTLTVTNCTLSDNATDWGGGIFNDGSLPSGAVLTMIASTLSRNSADFGGAIYNHAIAGTAKVTVVNCTFSANSAVGGGAIYNNSRDNGTATLTVTACTFGGNSADMRGGGIFNASSSDSRRYRGTKATVTLNASTFGDNSAGEMGGGAYNFAGFGDATLWVNGCTFSGNSAGSGGSIYNDGSGAGRATVEIANTILRAGSSGGNLFHDSSGRFGSRITSRGYNLCSDKARGFLSAKTDRINTDPMLGPLQDNGGPTFTHALLPGSPAIDRGNRAVIASLVLDTDQRGFCRPVGSHAVAGGDGSDIGAFEVQLPRDNGPSNNSQEVLP